MESICATACLTNTIWAAPFPGSAPPLLNPIWRIYTLLLPSLDPGSTTLNQSTIPKVGWMPPCQCLPLPFSLACLFHPSHLENSNWPSVDTVSLYLWWCLQHGQQWCQVLKPLAAKSQAPTKCRNQLSKPVTYWSCAWARFPQSTLLQGPTNSNAPSTTMAHFVAGGWLCCMLVWNQINRSILTYPAHQIKLQLMRDSTTASGQLSHDCPPTFCTGNSTIHNRLLC